MIRISLSPQRRDDTLTISVTGDTITLNGDTLDFSPLPEGGTLPLSAIDSPWVSSDVSRVGGRIELTVVMPHAADASTNSLFPQPITVTEDGPVELPT